MEKKNQDSKEYYAIDLMLILKNLLHRAWILALVGVVGAIIAFLITTIAIAPKYSSSVLLYVNNSSVSIGKTSLSISSGDISASKSLASTYGVILKSRTTLERLKEKIDLPYTTTQLSKMISTGLASNTEILRVTVTTNDPYQASIIANGIAEVLPERVAEIMDGSNMEVVDSAIPNLSKVSPNVARNTAIGLVVGILAAAAVIVVIVILDDTVHDEEYVNQTYNYPILAIIPDLTESDKKKYGYYYYN
ncbi:MAG: hypothetical protein J6128_01960 [Clostridia bacterium]|nr:hypothetical protein [Clostridia bacterium]